MTDEIWIDGEMARKTASEFVNEGGVPGVKAEMVDQAAFCVRNRYKAREWLFNQLERQRCREKYNIAFESDDGGEKERFAAARREYFDAYGEDFLGKDDPDMPWGDTRPEVAEETVAEAASDVASGGASGELARLRNENAALKAELDELNDRIAGLIVRLEGMAGGAVGAEPLPEDAGKTE